MRLRIICIFLFLFCLHALRESSAQADEQSTPDVSVAAEKDTISGVLRTRDFPEGVDSLFVIHFHPTIQCSCCINVGIFAKKGLEKYYGGPYKDSLIVFKECITDEDSLSAKRYKVLDSALGFEKFFEAKKEFKEIESVWDFCEDEERFVFDFRRELNRFLGISKEDTSQIDRQIEKVE